MDRTPATSLGPAYSITKLGRGRALWCTWYDARAALMVAPVAWGVEDTRAEATLAAIDSIPSSLRLLAPTALAAMPAMRWRKLCAEVAKHNVRPGQGHLVDIASLSAETFVVGACAFGARVLWCAWTSADAARAQRDPHGWGFIDLDPELFTRHVQLMSLMLDLRSSSRLVPPIGFAPLNPIEAWLVRAFATPRAGHWSPLLAQWWREQLRTRGVRETQFAVDSGFTRELAVLGLKPPCRRDEVVHAYRSRIAAVHSDHGGTVTEFMLVREAYERVCGAMATGERPPG